MLKRMETAIAGDEKLGVDGIHQRLENHEEQDEKRHTGIQQNIIDMGANMHSLRAEHQQTRSFVKGAAWVLGIVFVAVEALINFWK